MIEEGEKKQQTKIQEVSASLYLPESKKSLNI